MQGGGAPGAEAAEGGVRRGGEGGAGAGEGGGQGAAHLALRAGRVIVVVGPPVLKLLDHLLLLPLLVVHLLAHLHRSVTRVTGVTGVRVCAGARVRVRLRRGRGWRGSAVPGGSGQLVRWGVVVGEGTSFGASS